MCGGGNWGLGEGKELQEGEALKEKRGPETMEAVCVSWGPNRTEEGEEGVRCHSQK